MNTPYTPVNGDYWVNNGKQDNGGVVYLDRQRAFCGWWTYMTSFKFRMDGNQVKLDVQCINYNNQANYRPADYFTGWNDAGSGINYLDRHKLECPGGSALVGFEGITDRYGHRENFVDRGYINGGGGSFQFHYVCASSVVADAPVPTANPTLSPTRAPVSNPTLAPSALPTIAPSPAPISDPTPFPIALPTIAPSPLPIALPTIAPSPAPVADPTLKPISLPTIAPSPVPVANPTAAPLRLSIFQTAQGSWMETGRSNCKI